MVEDYFQCIICREVVHSSKRRGSTTELLRHHCVETALSNPLPVSKFDHEVVKNAAAKFIAYDLRPFNAVECPGFQEIFLAGVELGQKYPLLGMDDFKRVLPSRHTVKNTIKEVAQNAKVCMTSLFREAIQQYGFGSTLDLWTDSYKHNTYMAMTANIYLLRNTGIENKRLVFYMGHITDIVKSKELIRSRIINVFEGFEVATSDLKEKVTFTTDR